MLAMNKCTIRHAAINMPAIDTATNIDAFAIETSDTDTPAVDMTVCYRHIN